MGSLGGRLTRLAIASRSSPIPSFCRALVAITYIGLAVLLALGVSHTFLDRPLGSA